MIKQVVRMKKLKLKESGV